MRRNYVHKRLNCCRTSALYLLACIMLLLPACRRMEPIKGYTRDDEGFYYKLLRIGDGNENPKVGDVLLLDAVFQTQKDSTIWDSKNEGNNAFYLPLEPRALIGSFNSYLLKMVEGDSVSFYIPTAVFFRQYFDTVPPVFCKNDSMMKVGLRLIEIMSQAEYQQVIRESEKEQEDKELTELRQIDDYLKQHHLPEQTSSDGIYYLSKTESHGLVVETGRLVKLNYKGSFLDGRETDIPQKPMEFIYGTPDQLIKGLNIVIGGMKKGENAKIIVPSRLAFGEQGSANGSIPPYSPLLYEIEITDVK